MPSFGSLTLLCPNNCRCVAGDCSHRWDEAVWVWEAVRALGLVGNKGNAGQEGLQLATGRLHAGDGCLVELRVVEAACHVEDGAKGVALHTTRRNM